MTTEVTEGHNSAARADLFRTAMRNLDQIDSEIRVLQEQRTQIKNKIIKGDLGMKVADFNVVRRFYQLEQEKRDTLFDTLREGFAALGIGMQASFLETLEDAPAPAPTKPKRERKARAAQHLEKAQAHLNGGNGTGGVDGDHLDDDEEPRPEGDFSWDPPANLDRRGEVNEPQPEEEA